MQSKGKCHLYLSHPNPHPLGGKDLYYSSNMFQHMHSPLPSLIGSLVNQRMSNYMQQLALHRIVASTLAIFSSVDQMNPR